MSQLKATPGPWEIYHDGFSICAKDGHILSTFAEGSTTEEALANANLIAAAPDLYEALRELLVAVHYADPPRHFGKSDDEPNICHEARIPTDFVTIAERALTKARGEQSL